MINYNKNICVVILTGGRSSRMGGGIKSLKKFNNKTIFKRIFENLQTQVNKIIINSNDTKNLFIKYNVEVIKDDFEDFIGPLAGIHATFKWLNENYDARPKWNFYKFVINKDGKLENHFSSMTTPSSEQLTSVLDKIIK